MMKMEPRKSRPTSRGTQINTRPRVTLYKTFRRLERCQETCHLPAPHRDALPVEPSPHFLLLPVFVEETLDIDLYICSSRESEEVATTVGTIEFTYTWESTGETLQILGKLRAHIKGIFYMLANKHKPSRDRSVFPEADDKRKVDARLVKGLLSNAPAPCSKTHTESAVTGKIL